MTTDSSDLHGTLAAAVSAIIPAGTLKRQTLRDAPEISLYLIDQSYPQYALDGTAIETIMNKPPYWVFCWASGQVLARYLLDHPDIVRAKRVLDFGTGSGVVAIAAALAGASEVIACDTDPFALAACQLNAEINGVSLTVADDFHRVAHHMDVILVADVLYDRANFPWLATLASRADRVIVADSRVKDFALAPYVALGRFESDTVPDLDESASFREVTLYSTP